MNRKTYQSRALSSDFRAARSDENEPIIEGYFAVFNSETELWPGAFEQVAPEAFDNTMSNDIRALVDHETRLVLGRSSAGTLELKTDSHGLFCRIKINQHDTDAMNLYERVKRGDISQCSFGFNIIDEEPQNRDDGSVLFILRDIDLHEVSVVTFPAYENTSIQARKADFEATRKNRLEFRKNNMKERLNKLWH